MAPQGAGSTLADRLVILALVAQSTVLVQEYPVQRLPILLYDRIRRPREAADWESRDYPNG